MDGGVRERHELAIVRIDGNVERVDDRGPRGLLFGADANFGIMTRDLDLVQVEAVEAYTAKLPNFTFSTVVADADSNHPRKGWVTQHMPVEAVNDGDVDVYLCGPPPMVDAVRKHFDDNGVKPNSFHYEKFTPNAAPRTA